MSIITQSEYNMTKQRTREIDIKVQLLNFNFQVVDELKGNLIGSPTFTNSATSDIRRTCSVSLTPTSSSFTIEEGGRIWLDKYIKIYVAIKDIRTEEYIWTNMGIYLINNPSQVYSATDNTITIQGVDLVAKLTGLRNGYLEGLTYIIPQDSNIRQAIIAVLEESGFYNYIVDECEITVPNDIKVNIGGTAWDLLKQLRDIIPQYEMFFDVDGVFHYQIMPSGKNEQVFINDDIFEKTLISYNVNTDFDNVKNVIEVFGKTHDIKNYGGTATITNTNRYNITLAGMTELRKNLIIGFVAPNKVTDPTMQVKMTDTVDESVTEVYSEVLPIKDSKGNYATLEDKENVYYVVKYKKSLDYFYFYNIKKLSEQYSGDLLATVSRGLYNITRSDITVTDTDDLPNGTIIKFVTPMNGNSDIKKPKIKINDLTAITIDSVTPLLDNTEYTLKFSKKDSNEDYLLFMGEVTPYAIVKDDNPNSPFYIGKIGEINKPFTGGEYDNISSSSLALVRANWELYNYCRLQNTITLTCVPIYWADVNKVIEITLPHDNSKELYIIKSISTSFGVGDTQTLTCMKYYSYYEEN